MGRYFALETLTLRKKCPYSELFCSLFSRIRTEYGEIRSISPYLVPMREITDQNNSKYEHFSRSVKPLEGTPFTSLFTFLNDLAYWFIYLTWVSLILIQGQSTEADVRRCSVEKEAKKRNSGTGLFLWILWNF